MVQKAHSTGSLFTRGLHGASQKTPAEKKRKQEEFRGDNENVRVNLQMKDSVETILELHFPSATC